MSYTVTDNAIASTLEAVKSAHKGFESAREAIKSALNVFESARKGFESALNAFDSTLKAINITVKGFKSAGNQLIYSRKLTVITRKHQYPHAN